MRPLSSGRPITGLRGTRHVNNTPLQIQMLVGNTFLGVGVWQLSSRNVVSKYQVHSSSQGCHTATGTHMPRRITQCYLPPGRGDIPALTPAEAGTRLSDPGGLQG